MNRGMQNPIPIRGRARGASSAMRTPVIIRLPQALLDEIDKIAANRSDKPDRSNTIRELLVEALDQRRHHNTRGALPE